MKRWMSAVAVMMLFSAESFAAKSYVCEGRTEEQAPVHLEISVDNNDYATVKFAGADYENEWVGENTRVYRTIGGRTKITTAYGSRTEYFVKLEVSDDGTGSLVYEEDDSGWEYFVEAQVKCK
ncbi:polyketide synthase [Bdellovibrio bacteriovorus]|uniref:polyketide synthase n=1 Tax=Bdellovibrio bacteriovorus TaxID=959 RepID=UPI0021CE5237|nr:polyketide synthase [Bdellovibrio bacteriovorus]UXR65278.1 polyketide synthase [Bdellovibrio bacteriovorus]